MGRAAQGRKLWSNSVSPVGIVTQTLPLSYRFVGMHDATPSPRRSKLVPRAVPFWEARGVLAIAISPSDTRTVRLREFLDSLV